MALEHDKLVVCAKAASEAQAAWDAMKAAAPYTLTLRQAAAFDQMQAAMRTVMLAEHDLFGTEPPDDLDV